jgi:hypothetical protein
MVQNCLHVVSWYLLARFLSKIISFFHIFNNEKNRFRLWRTLTIEAYLGGLNLRIFINFDESVLG